jgi:hypothetical protein
MLFDAEGGMQKAERHEILEKAQREPPDLRALFMAGQT